MKQTNSLVLILTLTLATVSLATEGTWTQKADMPTARFGCAASEVNGKIYVIGGWDAWTDPTPLATVEAYDPASDTWESKADMPTARGTLATAVLDGKIYAIGGARGSSPFSTVEVYDPATDTWEETTSMSVGRWFHSAVVVDGKIYAIGGVSSSTMEEYDPATGTWTSKASMPTNRWVCGTGAANGRIYIIGGDAQGALSSVLEYDPATDRWTQKANMPRARAALLAAVVDGKIYAIGGAPCYDCPGLPIVEVYDPATDTWEKKADMPAPRESFAISVVNGRIYALGGNARTLGRALTTVEEYDPSPLVVDFNGDGIVDCADICMMTEHWLTNEPSYDISPRPFGDGIVDVQDMALLSEHLFEEPGLVAHWKLDETEGDIAQDSAGENLGFVVGSPVWQPTGGQINGAIQLDGVDDAIFAGPTLNPADGPFSVLAWVQGGAAGQAVISEPAGMDWLSLDPLTGHLMTKLTSAGRSAAPLLSQAVVTDGNWHRIGFVWDGLYRTLYVDGTAVAEDTQDGLVSPASGFYIGTGNAMASGTYFSGLIDDVRIYNRAVKP